MDKKSEERLFKLLRRAYEAQRNVTLSDEWRNSLMIKIADVTSKVDSPQVPFVSSFLIPRRFSIGVVMALVLAFATLFVVQQQLNLDLLGLAFELEQDNIL
jgi:hypothetical protein